MRVLAGVVIASGGAWDFPSTRDRLGPLARGADWPVEAISAATFPRDEQLDALTAAGSDGKVLILQRVLPDDRSLRRLRDAYGAIVFDIDDAIYSVPPEAGGSLIRSAAKRAGRTVMRGSPLASARRRPLIRVLREVDVAVVGNEILGDFVERFAPRTVEIPTTAEPVERLPASRDVHRVAWVGVPDNLQQLDRLGRALEKACELTPFELTVVSAEPWKQPTVPASHSPWSPESEREVLLESAIGLAPLTDDSWTRGKCARRAILYGAHGVAAIASPVGVTPQVVEHGRTGLLATREKEWVDSLTALLGDPEKTAGLGAAAHQHISRHYSDELAAREWIKLLSQLEQA